MLEFNFKNEDMCASGSGIEHTHTQTHIVTAEQINKLEKKVQYRDCSRGNMFHIWIMDAQLQKKKKNVIRLVWMQFFNVLSSISSVFIFTGWNFFVVCVTFLSLYLLKQRISLKRESNSSFSHIRLCKYPGFRIKSIFMIFFFSSLFSIAFFPFRCYFYKAQFYTRTLCVDIWFNNKVDKIKRPISKENWETCTRWTILNCAIDENYCPLPHTRIKSILCWIYTFNYKYYRCE